MKASAGARANLGWLKRALVHSNAPLVPLVEVESESWNLQTVLRGANERLIPILMTAAVTALGLAPLALSLRQPGQEIEGPMAVTVLGGLVSSTLLNLIVLPALAGRFIK
jgi:Cu/Ag efflux pump CusA